MVNFDNSSELLLVMHKRGNKSKEKVRDIFKQAGLFYNVASGQNINIYSSSDI